MLERCLTLLERYSPVLYPALAVATLAVLVAGIVRAWQSQELDGLEKAKLKEEILHELHRQGGGATSAAISRALGVAPLQVVKLLEEMKRDGVLVSRVNEEKLTVWQINGARC